MDWLQIDPAAEATFSTLGLSSCAAIIKFFSEPEPPLTTTVFVKPKLVRLPGDSTRTFFYKQYEYENPSWRYFARSSKARCEFKNYETFRRLGIASPARVACGEQRDLLGRLQRAFVVTEAIPRAWTLPQFIEEHCPARASVEARRLRAALLQQLAEMTRRIHTANFFHHDLVWRNLLVTWDPPAEPKLWWIDCPRGGFVYWSQLKHHRLLKDLASLDKSAAKSCTRRERVQFIKSYLGVKRLDAAAKQLIRDTQAYRKQRWPDDWQ